MGEIIVKVPDNVKKVFEINLPYSTVHKKIEELKREEKINEMIKFFERYKGSVEVEEFNDEDFYLQGD